VIARGDIMDVVKANSISTFGGNPLATAGALANLDYLLEHDLQANAFKVGQQLRASLDDLAEQLPNIGDVRGKGLMIGVEFVRPGSKDPDSGVTTRVMEEARTGGLLIGKGGLFGNVLRIAPPLSVTSEEAAEGYDILSAAVHRAIAD
jgi:4-aminobutyrate aminotransferase